MAYTDVLNALKEDLEKKIDNIGTSLKNPFDHLLIQFYANVRSSLGLGGGDSGGSGGATAAEIKTSVENALNDANSIDINSSPLPAGAATEAKQDDIVTAIEGIESSSSLPAGAATEAKQDDIVTAIEGIESSSDLPAGASTEAKQDTLITSVDLVAKEAKQDTIISALSGLSTAVGNILSAITGKNNSWTEFNASPANLTAPGNSAALDLSSTVGPVYWIMRADVASVSTDAVFKAVGSVGGIDTTLSEEVTLVSDGEIVIQGPATPMDDLALSLVSAAGGNPVVSNIRLKAVGI